ncbi:redoxin domain-containing protein [Arundinibacter roseus]|uniref:Redoxin domain-containing protein n=1 Tax=Arundinibacter roseus TaxID=2070510 RepID=A0A4R4KJ45_9BACT|nr:redoxin domain-containing protein [Arundinibacter roseus]TDB68238.1 redoxin domain-containing protein [Arundinibacter roseus]
MLYEIIDEEGIVHSISLRPRPATRSKSHVFSVGQKAPRFALYPQNMVCPTGKSKPAGWIQSSELLKRPLVLAFFCEGWGETYTAKMIEKFSEMNASVEKTGAEFLVLTQQNPSALAKWTSKLNIQFTMAYDENNRIARLFGAYDAQNPVWDRVPGINGDVTTPAVFIINSQETFSFAALDRDFEFSWDDAAFQEALYADTINQNQLRYA